VYKIGYRSPFGGVGLSGFVQLCANIFVAIERGVVFSSSASMSLEHLAFPLSGAAILFSLEIVAIVLA